MKIKAYLEQTILSLTETTTLDHVFVTQILQSSGVCKKTFYKYYIDKYDLFNNALEDYIYSKITEEKNLNDFLKKYISLCAKYRKSLVNSFNSNDHNSPKKKNIDFLTAQLEKYLHVDESKNNAVQAYAEMLTNQMIKFLASESVEYEALTNFLYSLVISLNSK